MSFVFLQVFARAVIQAIDQLYRTYNVSAFVKLDANGVAGWSCMSPNDHAIVFDYEQEQEKRINYLYEYITNKVTSETLPILAVVEEFIEPQKRSGDIDADYTVCGFVLNGKLFPTPFFDLEEICEEEERHMLIVLPITNTFFPSMIKMPAGNFRIYNTTFEPQLLACFKQFILVTYFNNYPKHTKIKHSLSFHF